MIERVLLVDDEPNVLDGLRRQLRKRVEVDTAVGGEEALAKLGEGAYAVVVSDMRMPGMDGAQLLNRVRAAYPDTVRMMLTGNADVTTAVQAVNEGHVFRFLTKPCTPEALTAALRAGIQQHQLITAEKTLLRQTLRGAIAMLSEVLELAAPKSFGCGKRVQRLVRQLAQQLQLPSSWEIELAALFANIGHIILPPDVLDRSNSGAHLTGLEREMLSRAMAVSSQLVNHLPRLEGVARILGRFAAESSAEGTDEDGLVGARILRLAYDFDAAVTGGETPPKAISVMRERGVYADSLLDALATCVRARVVLKPARVPVRDLANGMYLEQDLVSSRGQLLVSKGQEVTLTMRERLANFIRSDQLQGDVSVLVPVAESGVAEALQATDVAT